MLPVSGSQGKRDVQPWGSSVPATRGEAGLSGNALREDVAAGDPEPTATGRPAGLKASQGAGRRSEGTSPSRSPDLAGVCVRTRAGVYRMTEGPKAQGPRWDWQRGLRGGHRPRRHSLPQKEPVPWPVCQALSPAPPSAEGAAETLMRCGGGADTCTEHRGDHPGDHPQPKAGPSGVRPRAPQPQHG